jgi:RNA polymerase sigma factor (sigma-70 family)
MQHDDLELLHAYAADGSEAAFRTVVDRHLALVYSSALRQVRNPHLAEEVTQAVFLILARKANSLRPGTLLTGWFFRTTRFASIAALRTVRRRERHEQEAAQMQPTITEAIPEASWDDVAPLLDEAIADLGATDRHAILLRYFERKDHKEIGHALGATEEAAKKRVTRAVEKIRTFLTRRGVALSVTALGAAVFTHGVQAAPPALSQSIAAALTANSTVTTTTLSLIAKTMKAMFLAKLQTAAVYAAVLLAAGAGTYAVLKAADTKTTQAAAPAPAKFDRSTPLGALRDLADALKVGDRDRVVAAIHTENDAAKVAIAAMGEMAAAQGRLRKTLVERFGAEKVEAESQTGYGALGHLNFGQAALDGDLKEEEVVQYTAPDRCTVRLSDRPGFGGSEGIPMIRVTGVWKMTGGKLDAMAGQETKVTAMFSAIAQQALEVDREVAGGKYETFEIAIEALKKKMAAGVSRAGTPGQPPTR